ncbi:MAG: electron transfer flavoprotein beta subunit/FixA family protein [Salinirussus sp.]
MDVLACIKRVPDTGATIVLTEDGQDIDTSNLGFTMSPHEECAIEEAISLTETHGGTSRVLTLGPEEATEQLRTGLAMGADEATLLETDGGEWSPRETAAAIADAVSDDGALDHDILLFGNESADMANYQVGVRVARHLDVPVVTGIKDLVVENGTAVAKREVSGGREVYEVDLPAVITVKEGINAPRYASMRSKMQARKQSVDRASPDRSADSGTFEKVELIAPESDEGEAEILGEGPDAVPRVIEVLQDEVEVL